MAHRNPDLQRAVDFVENRLRQLPQPPTSKASAPDSKLRILLSKAGYRRRSERILAELQSAFEKRHIACDPKVDDPRNKRDTRIHFFRDQLPDGLVHESALFQEEKHLEQFIEANYAVLAAFRGLELVKRQYPLGPNGKHIDLMFRDTSTGDLVGVELKKGPPDERTVQQLKTYLGDLEVEAKRKECGFRLILITGQPDVAIEETLGQLCHGGPVELWRYKVDLGVEKSSFKS